MYILWSGEADLLLAARNGNIRPLRVANTGQVPTSRVTIRDTLPPSLQIIGTNPITPPVGSTFT